MSINRKYKSFHDIWDNICKHKLCYLFIAPFFVMFFVFTVAPVVSSIALSTTYYNILQPPRFIGLENYAQILFADDLFMKALVNTLIMACTIGPIGYLASLLLAWTINELPHSIRTAMVFFIYAPSISGGATLLWTLIFNSDSYGYANSILMTLGIIKEPILWFMDTRFMMPLVIIISLWASMGAGFLSFVAGLKGMDMSLYEAGMLDGIKNRWQELWYITLPQLKPQLIFGAVMSISSGFAAGGMAEALCGFPSTDYAVYSLISHIADYGGSRFEMGYSAALSVVLFLLMIGSNSLIRRLLRNVGS